MDQPLLELFNQTIASPALDIIMPIITIYGLLALPLFGIILCFGRFSKRTNRVGRSLLAALFVGFLLTFLFYFLALRPRPDAVRLIMPQPNFPSFPSGHTVLAFATTALLTLFAKQTNTKKAQWALVAIGSLPLALLIAISRLYLGHHHPTDIIAGAILGCATGAAAYGLLLTNETGARRFRWLLWLQVAFAILVSMMAYLNLLRFELLNWPYSDKVLHFILFGAITFWLYLWMPNAGIKIGRWLLPFAIIIPITIAFLEELLQGTSSRRTASLADLGFDLAGMICFCLLAHWLIERDKPHNESIAQA